MNRLIISVLLLALVTGPASAWQFYQGYEIGALQPGFAVVDPDNFSRDDVAKMHELGVKPLAWLNLAQIEQSRIIPFDMRERDYIFPRQVTAGGKPLARFYTAQFRQLVRMRVQEYLMKGFAGVLLGRTADYEVLSNSPVNRSEMWNLIVHLARVSKKLNPAALVIVHDNGKFAHEAARERLVDGVLVEGLFNGQNGRHIYQWERQDRLKQIQDVQKAHKLVFSAETSNTAGRVDQAVSEAQELGVIVGFTQLPLIMERIQNND